MKITNGECFVIENALQSTTAELRESKVKNLLLNVCIGRNLQKVSEITASYRKEIQEFMPAELKALNEKSEEELTEEEKLQKTELTSAYNASINEFLSKSMTIEFAKFDLDLKSLAGVETTYDNSNIIALILSDEKESK